MKNRSLLLILATITFATLLFIAGCNGSTDNKPVVTDEKAQAIEIENTKPAVGVMSPTLINIYKSNPLRAEELFDHKVILVGGIAKEIGRYEKEPEWLYMVMANLSGYEIRAEFRDVYADDLRKIRTNKDGIIVKGRCWINKDANIIVISGAKIVPPEEILKVKLIE